MLFDGRSGIDLLELLGIGGDLQRPEPGEFQAFRLRPMGKPRGRRQVGGAGVRVADLGAKELGGSLTGASMRREEAASSCPARLKPSPGSAEWERRSKVQKTFWVSPGI